MTIYEALKFLSEPLERLEMAGVKPNDHKYVKLFENYQEARERGEKVGYIVAMLADRYGVSERTVYDVVRRFGRTANAFQWDNAGNVTKSPETA